MKLREAGRICLSAILAGVAICAIYAMMGGEKVAAQGQEAEKEPFSAIFVKTDAMIPMRDGVKLHTEIYAPKNAAEKLPLFITRTPYGLADDGAGYSRLLGLYREMFADGYIFVMQDIRGRYGSEGKFVMGRAPRDRKDPKSIDEGTDTYEMRAGFLALLVGLAVFAICAVGRGGKVSAQGQEAEKEPFSAIFVKTDAMIPMRDGVKLHTEIYAPKNAAEKLPLFITRTPYGLQMMTPVIRACSASTARCSRTATFSCCRIFAVATVPKVNS